MITMNVINADTHRYVFDNETNLN